MVYVLYPFLSRPLWLKQFTHAKYHVWDIVYSGFMLTPNLNIYFEHRFVSTKQVSKYSLLEDVEDWKCRHDDRHECTDNDNAKDIADMIDSTSQYHHASNYFCKHIASFNAEHCIENSFDKWQTYAQQWRGSNSWWARWRLPWSCPKYKFYGASYEQACLKRMLVDIKRLV